VVRGQQLLAAGSHWMAKYRFRLFEFEAQTSPNEPDVPTTWKWLCAGFLTSLAAGLVLALLL
jgi:hypothetical protein